TASIAILSGGGICLALEFNKIINQVYKLGSMVEHLDFDIGVKLRTALERLDNPPPLEKIRERVNLVPGTSGSGYRGAVPLEGSLYEDISAVYDLPPTPERATIIGADGSQIYPNEQAPVHYYLTTVGLYVYHP